MKVCLGEGEGEGRKGKEGREGEIEEKDEGVGW